MENAENPPTQKDRQAADAAYEAYISSRQFLATNPQYEIAKLESRIEALRMARPHFEAFNKSVLTVENEIIGARQNLIAVQENRPWLTKLFIAFGTDKEAKQFDSNKASYLMALERVERELIGICPKAYSKPKQRPGPADLASVFGDVEEQRRARSDELKYLLYDIDADIRDCEARIAELKPKAEAAARAAENRRLSKERQENKEARIKQILDEARSSAQRIALSLPRNHPCPYCGGALGDSPEADHIHPVAKGGHSTRRNMVYVCRECNALKSDSTLTAFITKEGRDLAKILDRLRQLGKDV